MTDSRQIGNQPIYVVLVVRLEGIFFNPHRPEGIEFLAGGDLNLRFHLLPMQPDKDASGMNCGLKCKVYATYYVSSEQSIFIDAYNHKQMLRVADGVELPLVNRSGSILINEEGYFSKGFHPRRNACPSDIVQLIDKVEADLTTHAERFLKLIRWRQGIDSSGDIIKSTSLYWSIHNKGEYPGAPLPSYKSESKVLGLLGIQWDEKYTAEISDLWNNPEVVEPLGHALLREAASIANESPRSAILIMTAALETAVKMHISRMAPDTAWLMEETPSPPIFKIMRDYIPSLHEKAGHEINFWQLLRPGLKNIQTLVEVRNKVAHTGKIPSESASIVFCLELVRDWLYILDVLDGMEWAKTRVSSDMRKLLGWPKPNNGRLLMTIKLDEY